MKEDSLVLAGKEYQKSILVGSLVKIIKDDLVDLGSRFIGKPYLVMEANEDGLVLFVPDLQCPDRPSNRVEISDNEAEYGLEVLSLSTQ